MAQFVMPDSFDMPDLAPPDPVMNGEDKIANDARVEQAVNSFLTAKQGALFEAPDAFYRQQGEDAIHAAPVVTKNLDQIRADLLDGLANDYQRNRLSNALDAQMELTRDGMSRHVAEQSLAWQRGIAQNRIALLTKEATHHHNDDELIDTLGHAAANAARAHARVGAGPPGGETEDAAAASARSGVLGAAIQARLDRGDTGGANALLMQVQDQLHPEHAAPLQGQLDTAQRLNAAKAYAGELVPVWSDTSHEELDAQHAAATQQNQTDNQAEPAYQADVQHVLDVQRATQKRGIDDESTQRVQEVADWLSRAIPDGKPQTNTPPPSVRRRLTPDEQTALDKQLVIHARGAVPAGTEAVTPTTPNPDIVPIQFNSGESTPSANQTVQSPTSVGRSGTAPPTEPPSNSIDLERDFEQMQGRIVQLPNGDLVPNAYSDSGYLMSPFSDLGDVAAAGRSAPERVKELMGYDLLHVRSYIRKVIGDAVSQGGTWDYQRRQYAFGKDGFTQLRQFRDVANFNVGLYCQQAGLPLDMVLDEAGKYAAKNSKNAAPDQLHGLDPRTREQIELGYKIGLSGVFNRSQRQ
jgi:hypothetical protein